MEVLECENILRQKEDSLPTFLNLSFEEVCISSLMNHKFIDA